MMQSAAELPYAGRLITKSFEQCPHVPEKKLISS